MRGRRQPPLLPSIKCYKRSSHSSGANPKPPPHPHYQIGVHEPDDLPAAVQGYSGRLKGRFSAPACALFSCRLSGGTVCDNGNCTIERAVDAPGGVVWTRGAKKDARDAQALLRRGCGEVRMTDICCRCVGKG